MKSRRWLIGTIAGIAVFLVAGRIAAGWCVEYQWYAALGAAAVWRVRALNMLLLRGMTFLVGALFVFVNLYAVRRSVVSLVLPRRVGNLEFGEEVPSRYLLVAVVALSVLVGGLLALPHDDWISLDLIRHGELFGESDPYFQHDLAFWLYWLPLESALHFWAIISLLAVALIVIFLYALTPSLRWESGRLHVSGYVRRHLFTLGAILLLLLSWSYRLDAYNVLNAGSGPLGAFTAIDHRVGMPASLILSLAAIAAAMLTAWSGWTGQIRLAFFTITGVLLVALALRQIVPPVAERFISPSDPELRERPYRAIRNGYTRRAYDVDRLTAGDSSASPTFLDVLRGASLWDGNALARAIARSVSSARPNGGMGWDAQDGRLVAFVVQQPAGPDAADSQPPWRVTRVAADMADERGGIVLRDDPDVLSSNGLPPILVHDSASSYYVVSDSTGRVAAPLLRAFRTRLAHAWHLQNPRLLAESPHPEQTRIVLRRDVRQRLRALYPFFDQSTSVAPVVWRDSLYWVVHLYAASSWYPLSEKMVLGHRDVHFLRHAAVALVNAHTGSTTAVGDPLPDPLTISWMRRFPTLFTLPSAIDEDLLKRVPPPLDAALVAAAAFARVGVRREERPSSHLPRHNGGDSSFTMVSTPPYYDRVLGRLGLAIPLLDTSDRLFGVVTSIGGDEYRPRWRPLRSPGPSWTALVDRLQRSGDSLRSVVRDARLLQGAVRAIPTADGVVAMQTHYTSRPDGTPQEFYVSVLRGDSIFSGITLLTAAGMPMPTAAPAPLTPEEFRQRVESLYGAMRDALRRGDWKGFGSAYEALGRLLRVER